MSKKGASYIAVFLSIVLLLSSGCSGIPKDTPSQSASISSDTSSASVSSFDMATKIIETDKYKFELPETWGSTTISGNEVYRPNDIDLAKNISFFYVQVSPGEEIKLSVNGCEKILLPKLRKSLLETYPNANDFIYFNYKSAKGPVFVASSRVNKDLIMSSYCILNSKDTIVMEAVDSGNAGAIRLHDVVRHAIDTIEIK